MMKTAQGDANCNPLKINHLKTALQNVAFCNAKHGLLESDIFRHDFQKVLLLKIFYVLSSCHTTLPLRSNHDRHVKFIALTLVREPQTLYICA